MKRLLSLLIVIGIYFSACAQKDNLEELGLQLENYEYPYKVHKLLVNNQNQELEFAYMDIQPPDYNNKNVLLLHGKNFNGAYWETTIEALSREGYRVIVPDQIGFGKSSKPEYLQYSFQQLATNTKNLLDSLGVSEVAVLGHSMGGMLATRFALMFPDVSEKLILVNPIGLEDYKRKVPYQPVTFWYESELDKNFEKIRQYQQENYYDGEWRPEYDEWVNILAGWTLNENYPLIAWNAALTYDMIFTQPVVHEFPDIKSPTLLIIGTRDRTALGKSLVSREVKETMGQYEELGKTTQKAIPDAQLVELEGLGHLPHIEDFDRFIVPLLEFLK